MCAERHHWVYKPSRVKHESIKTTEKKKIEDGRKIQVEGNARKGNTQISELWEDLLKVRCKNQSDIGQGV